MYVTKVVEPLCALVAPNWPSDHYPAFKLGGLFSVVPLSAPQDGIKKTL